MRYAARRLIGSAALLCLVPSAPAHARQASYAEAEAGEEGAVYGRLRYLEGGLTLRRGPELRDDLALNDPVVPGDTLTTGPGSRGEVQLADGSIVILDVETELVLLSLADTAGQIENTTLLQLGAGSVIVRAERLDRAGRRFQVDTESASIFLLSNGTFRVNVRPDGTISVFSRRGVAEVMSREVSSVVRSGERLFVRPDQIPGEARPFNTRLSDAFDEWAAGRDDALLRRVPVDEDVPPGLPEPVAPYASELSYYGQWHNNTTYGWVWRPVGLAGGWQPYLYGRWVSSPAGLVWVSYEPWGWAPFHYGRWEFLLGSGWVWIPGYAFSGAYVAWSVAPGYFGWCPLGYYDAPVFLHFNVAARRAPWVYVAERHLYDRLVHRTVVRDVTVVREIEKRRIVVRKVPVSVRAGRINAAPRAAEEVYRVVSNRPELQLRPETAAPRMPFRDQELRRQVKLNDRRLRKEPGVTGVPRGRTIAVRSTVSVAPVGPSPPPLRPETARTRARPAVQGPAAPPQRTYWRPPAARPDDRSERTIQGMLPRSRPGGREPAAARPAPARRPEPQARPGAGQGQAQRQPQGAEPKARPASRDRSGSSSAARQPSRAPRPAPQKGKDAKGKGGGKN